MWRRRNAECELERGKRGRRRWDFERNSIELATNGLPGGGSIGRHLEEYLTSSSDILRLTVDLSLRIQRSCHRSLRNLSPSSPILPAFRLSPRHTPTSSFFFIRSTTEWGVRQGPSRQDSLALNLGLRSENARHDNRKLRTGLKDMVWLGSDQDR